MDRRIFLKCAVALPLFFIGRRDQTMQPPMSLTAKREVVLLDTAIAGWQYHQGDSIWKTLHPDDMLLLCREPQNPYDELAIAVYACGIKLGYVPRIHNTVIAGLIDQNASVKAHILKKHKTSYHWEKIEIRITMAA